MFDLKFTERRRWLFAAAASTAATLGLTAAARDSRADEPASAGKSPGATDFQRWLDGIGGRYRQLYDVTEAKGGMGLAWSWVFLKTAPEGYAVPESDLSVVVVFRHTAAVMALGDEVWAKYRLGEVARIDDPATKAPAVRNPFAHVKPGDLPIADAAIDRLVERGVRFAVCNMALTRRSEMLAKQQGLDPAVVRADWIAAIMPGIQLVPSGVLAVNGAQAKGCSYCFAG
jgi:intracellular sulfur oxidation DsrE/DsrF family protein